MGNEDFKKWVTGSSEALPLLYDLQTQLQKLSIGQKRAELAFLQLSEGTPKVVLEKYEVQDLDREKLLNCGHKRQNKVEEKHHHEKGSNHKHVRKNKTDEKASHEKDSSGKLKRKKEGEEKHQKKSSSHNHEREMRKEKVDKTSKERDVTKISEKRKEKRRIEETSEDRDLTKMSEMRMEKSQILDKTSGDRDLTKMSEIRKEGRQIEKPSEDRDLTKMSEIRKEGRQIEKPSEDRDLTKMSEKRKEKRRIEETSEDRDLTKMSEMRMEKSQILDKISGDHDLTKMSEIRKEGRQIEKPSEDRDLTKMSEKRKEKRRIEETSEDRDLTKMSEMTMEKSQILDKTSEDRDLTKMRRTSEYVPVDSTPSLTPSEIHNRSEGPMMTPPRKVSRPFWNVSPPESIYKSMDDRPSSSSEEPILQLTKKIKKDEFENRSSDEVMENLNNERHGKIIERDYLLPKSNSSTKNESSPSKSNIDEPSSSSFITHQLVKTETETKPLLKLVPDLPDSTKPLKVKPEPTSCPEMKPCVDNETVQWRLVPFETIDFKLKVKSSSDIKPKHQVPSDAIIDLTATEHANENTVYETKLKPTGRIFHRRFIGKSNYQHITNTIKVKSDFSSIKIPTKSELLCRKMLLKVDYPNESISNVHIEHEKASSIASLSTVALNKKPKSIASVSTVAYRALNKKPSSIASVSTVANRALHKKPSSIASVSTVANPDFVRVKYASGERIPPVSSSYHQYPRTSDTYRRDERGRPHPNKYAPYGPDRHWRWDRYDRDRSRY